MAMVGNFSVWAALVKVMDNPELSDLNKHIWVEWSKNDLEVRLDYLESCM